MDYNLISRIEILNITNILICASHILFWNIPRGPRYKIRISQVKT